MFFLALATWLHLTLTLGLIQKETTLNAQTTSQNGASLHHNVNTVTISDTNYQIAVGVQEEDYDLKLSLNDSWSFQYAQLSTITLTFNGETPHPDSDTDFLLVFSVNDRQYISFFLHLDYTHNIKCHIYGSISMQNITRLVSEWISDDTIHTRWDRISNNGKWLLPSDGFNKRSHFPLKFIIHNDIINNKIIFEFYNQITQTYASGYIFDNVFFMPNTPIDVYVMGDSTGEQFIVSNVNIQLNYNESTTTNIPTIIPTNIPTIIPTNIPTNLPSKYIYPTNSTITIDNDNIILTRQYRIIITITFEYKLSINDTYKVVSILNDIILNKIINKTCLNSTIIEEETQTNITIINATIFLCNNLKDTTEIINVSNANNTKYFQQQLIQNINQQTELQIIKNKTNIEIIITDNNINNIVNKNNNETLVFETTNNYFIQTNEIDNKNFNKNSVIKETELTLMLWVIKLIVLQVLLCCVMGICVFTLKFRTNKLKSKKYQISQKVNKMSQINSEIIIDNDQSNTVDTSINHNNRILSNLNLNANKRLAFLQLKSITNEPDETDETDGINQISNKNLCILKILESECGKHIPQQSDTITQERRQILFDKQQLALQNLKSRHQILSDVSMDDIPSIPNTTRRSTRPTDYTQTFTTDTNVKSTSPTFTYQNSRIQRGLV